MNNPSDKEPAPAEAPAAQPFACTPNIMINAQHEETGHMWRGLRHDLPERYYEIPHLPLPSGSVPTDPKQMALTANPKPPMHLLPSVFEEETAKALGCGAAKYGPWNWRASKVELMTYIGAMRRHLAALVDGEDIDPESGAHHLGHVAAGCAIVLDAFKHGTLIDNRPPSTPCPNHPAP